MKKSICFLLALVLLFCVTTSTLAETSPIYGAGTCTIGFTTSRYLDRGTSWGSTIKVYNYYVIWDDTWEYDFYQNVYAINGNVVLSELTRVYTGYSTQNSGAPVYSNASTNRSIYVADYTEIELYSNASGYNKIYLRINKPNVTNWLNNEPVSNMKTWGWFQK